MPAEGDARSVASKAQRHAAKASKSFTKSDATHNTLPAKSKEGFGSSNSLASDAYRRSASPVFLSPATSLNSNSSSTALSSGGSDNFGQQSAGSKDADSFADAVDAAANSNSTSGHAVKDSTAAARQTIPTTAAGATEKLSSAALKKMDGGKGGKSGKSRSAKSHSRSSSVEWQDVELQSEAEDERQHDRQLAGHRGKAGGSSQKAGPPSDRAVAVSAEYAESDNESELGISEADSHERSAEHATMPAQGTLLPTPVCEVIAATKDMNAALHWLSSSEAPFKVVKHNSNLRFCASQAIGSVFASTEYLVQIPTVSASRVLQAVFAGSQVLQQALTSLQHPQQLYCLMQEPQP